MPLIDEDGREIKTHALLVNGLYGAFDVVPKAEAEKFSAGNFTDLSLALRERLALRGHLTRKDEAAEFADMKLLARINKKIYAKLVVSPGIMPTYDCNFRCPYCYEQHRLKNGQAWLDRTISDEIIAATFSALKDYKTRGEPLLEKNISVVRRICEYCRSPRFEN